MMLLLSTPAPLSASSPEPSANPLGCPDPWSDPDTALLLNRLDFWFGGVLYCCIGVAGIVGNAVCIRIFALEDMKSTFHAFLLALSLYDLLFLLVTVTSEVLNLNSDNLNNDGPPYPVRASYAYLFPTFLWPLSQIFTTASIFMTVALSINRYLVVFYPFRYMSRPRRPPPCSPNYKGDPQRRIDHLCDCGKGDSGDSGGGIAVSPVETRRVAANALTVLVLSVLYCVPAFFEYRTGVDPDTGEPTVEWTKLRESKLYTEIYTIACDFIFRAIIPLGVILFTGIKIFFELRRLCGNRRPRGSHFAGTFASVVLLFFLSQSVKLANNIYNLTFHDQQMRCQQHSGMDGTPAAGYILEDVARVALIINNSVCFVAYLVSSPGFRAHVRHWYCLRRHPGRKGLNARANRKRKSPSVSLTTPEGEWYIIFPSTSREIACYLG